ncbi:hypothetical protein BC938DRAFT_472304, partial [Jimgerdemannia flammicorona]
MLSYDNSICTTSFIGDVTNQWGDVTNQWGNVTNQWGDVTNQRDQRTSIKSPLPRILNDIKIIAMSSLHWAS